MLSKVNFIITCLINLEVVVNRRFNLIFADVLKDIDKKADDYLLSVKGKRVSSYFKNAHVTK